MAVALTGDVTIVETPHGRVRVRDTGGDGRPVLLLHGLLVDGGFYATLVPLLRDRGYRCIVPDLPLGAHSPALLADADVSPAGVAALVAEVLDALEVPTADVVGVDTGGAITQILMAHHRTHVGRVVLTACDAYDAFPPPMLAPLLPRRKAALRAVATLARLRVVRRLALPRTVTHAGVDDAVATAGRSPRATRACAGTCTSCWPTCAPDVTLAAAEANRDFPRPVLVAWGDDARLFPRRLGERLAAELPDARLVTIPDCAAFAALDQPERLAALVDEHLSADRVAG